MPEMKLLSELVATISTGDFDAVATRELTKAVEAVEAGFGKASVTVKFTIAKDGRMVVVTPTVKATVPVAPAPKSMFFVSPRGELTEDDPKQTVLPLHKPTAKVINLDGGKPKTTAAPPDGEAKTTTDGKDN